MDYLNYASSMSNIQSSSDYASSLFQQAVNSSYNDDLLKDMTTLNEAQSNAIANFQSNLEETGLLESEAGVAIQKHIQNLANTAEISQKITEGIGAAGLAKKAVEKSYSTLKGKVKSSSPETQVEKSSSEGIEQPEEGIELTQSPTELEEIVNPNIAEDTVGEFAQTSAEATDVALETGAELGSEAVTDTALLSGLGVADAVMASSVVLEPLALVGGAVTLGIGIADSIKASDRERKEAKKKKKEVAEEKEESETQYEKQTTKAQNQYETSKKEATQKANKIRESLISNTHLSVIGGHQSLRL